MTTSAFTAGQRVYHRQRRQFGTYVEASWTSGESIAAFPLDHVPGLPDEDEELRVTTAQLVPADEVDLMEALKASLDRARLDRANKAVPAQLVSADEVEESA